MKKSRTFRKSFVSAIAALCLAAPLAMMPVSAHDITITQPSDGGTATHTYVAYQIFSGNYDSESKVLSNINWGSGIDQGQLNLLVAEIQTIDGFAGLSTASDIAKKLGEKNTDTAVATSFAKIVGKYLSNTTSGASSSTGVTDLNDGYYLIKDGAAVSGAGAKTDYILEVAGRSTSIEAKSSIPTIVKKVQENTELNNDYTSNSTTYDNYNDVADYNIGDDVPFLDDGTLPSDIGSYDEYYYQIVDIPGEKFTPNIGYDESTGKVNVNTTDESDNEVTVKIDGVKVDPNDVVVEYKDTGTDGIKEIVVTFKDIKNVDDVDGNDISVDSTSHVTVEYTAKLNEDAVIGLDGQESKVVLNFSNDPNENYSSTTDGDGKPDGVGTTPEDKVIVFTYELDITKYLESEATKANATSGTNAGFKIAPAEYETDGTTLKATLSWSNEYFTNADGLVEIKGLDDGKYVIRETTTPTGYNTMSDMVIEIKANAVYTQNWLGDPNEALKDVDLLEGTTYHDGTADGTSDNVDKSDAKENGVVNMKIINQRGSSLPSTGGIGTTIFYLGGGTMAAVAGVYLITKKRMKNEEDDEI